MNLPGPPPEATGIKRLDSSIIACCQKSSHRVAIAAAMITHLDSLEVARDWLEASGPYPG